MKSKILFVAGLVGLGCISMGVASAADDASKGPHHLVCSSPEVDVDFKKTDICKGHHHWDIVMKAKSGASCSLGCWDLRDSRAPVRSDADDKDLKDRGARVHAEMIKEHPKCSKDFDRALGKRADDIHITCHEEK